MVSLTTPVCNFDAPAIDFELPDAYKKMWNLEKAKGQNGTLIAFICNHCPYIKAILPRLVEDVRKLKDEYGVNTVAIMSNDQSLNEEDSTENMIRISEEMDFSFPYLIDETQEIAKAYGAVCTPDFFGFSKDMTLQYRGRFDESRKETSPEGVRRDLLEAMQQIAKTGQGPLEQIPSMGCSIKWKN
ncbi:thioredoxin family protein [Thiomicrorhabdus sp.]|uniref:thioredoxin family protein n=1 Tax=Thiomicrorhabdus sp. TaxID=2039724 RepID=UPI002AA5FFED|nr:thioredoxin family protein [Thiomicrorhabdus sp.]